MFFRSGVHTGVAFIDGRKRSRDGVSRSKSFTQMSDPLLLPIANASRLPSGECPARSHRCWRRRNLRLSGRPAVGHFAGVELRHRYRRSAGGRDPRENAGEVQCRDDVGIVAPASAIAQGRAAFHRNLFELALDEEPDPIARRRKERGLGVLGPGERRGLAWL